MTKMRELISTTVAIATCCGGSAANARFLQVDPVGYKDQVNLYAYVENDPLNHADPTGMRDIYIGGASDKDRSKIVQTYADSQRNAHPARDIRFFSWADSKGISQALSERLSANEPLNVIGHSLGAAEALIEASVTAAKIDNLITIDPVGYAGDGSKPENVGTWASVTAHSKDRDFSDTVASAGRLLLGNTNTSGADVSVTSSSTHGDFPSMMSQVHAPQTIDSSYRNGATQCGAQTGVPC